jgi:hypothetical protein
MKRMLKLQIGCAHLFFIFNLRIYEWLFSLLRKDYEIIIIIFERFYIYVLINIKNYLFCFSSQSRILFVSSNILFLVISILIFNMRLLNSFLEIESLTQSINNFE